MKQEKSVTSRLWIYKMMLLVFADIMIVLVSYFMALMLRFDFVFSSIPQEYLICYMWSMPFWVISTVVVFYLCKLYHSMMFFHFVHELQILKQQPLLLDVLLMLCPM